MKKLKLSFDGITELTREQQRSINGGSGNSADSCRFTVFKNGSKTVFYRSVPGPDSSSNANSYCVYYMNTYGYDRCLYNCFHDGFDQ